MSRSHACSTHPYTNHAYLYCAVYILYCAVYYIWYIILWHTHMYLHTYIWTYVCLQEISVTPSCLIHYTFWLFFQFNIIMIYSCHSSFWLWNSTRFPYQQESSEVSLVAIGMSSQFKHVLCDAFRQASRHFRPDLCFSLPRGLVSVNGEWSPETQISLLLDTFCF